MRRCVLAWILAAGALLLPALAGAQVAASLVSPQTSVQPGQPVTVALRLAPDAGWHTFWANPGTGLPTRIDWHLPMGWSAGAIEWPTPSLIHDEQGEISGQGYPATVYLPVRLTPPPALMPGRDVTLRADAHWLMCKTICVPGHAEVALTLPVSPLPSPPNQPIAAALAAMPMPGAQPDWKFAASRDAHDVALTVAAPHALSSAHFYPLDKFVSYKLPQTVAGGNDRELLKVPFDPDEPMPAGARLRGVLAYTDAAGVYRGVDVDVPFTTGAAGAAMVGAATTGGGGGATLSLGVLGLALLGGLILNLMPCVFPVLGIKVLGFVEQAGQNRRRATFHGVLFTLGVLLSFWLLAGALALLRAGGGQLGWGFQLQSPAFVFGLAVVMLVFALNLSGVFEVGTHATAIGSRLQQRRGLAGSFFTGVLATVVATPCSAPFLAPALGAALALPTGQSFAVFTAIGIGLSLPYLAFAAVPALLRFLPRPGRWMETFRQLMAFSLYATVGYLVWILAGQVDAHRLLNLLLALPAVALAAWAYGRFRAGASGTWRRRLAAGGAIVVLALALVLGWPRATPPSAIAWQSWSPERVAALQAEGRPIYVDFTARWCATCQVNKRVVFASAEVLRYFRQHHVATLEADWTNNDPRITAALAKYGRSAVPFNLVYTRDAKGASPTVLPEVLTPQIVLAAFESAAPAAARKVAAPGGAVALRRGVRGSIPHHERNQNFGRSP